nr:immunoglobulin light chain junction region [Macaca mulatta]MOW39280.1 immunoglobulin light chain junction region [Macaca mulatta]MOW39478.1 immunoglobulin light chain junction region [Macaca mulatta]MOW39589.1 immunoglobulin light chain junction region [Macaca mulatta]MOW40270.1 immunoglobulin light chain junction region [Macaca mulatta]
CMQGRKWPYSF